MKKIIILSLFILFPINIYSDVTHGIRESDWGMTRVEVLASEDIKPVKMTDIFISYKVNILGNEGFLLYEFVENSLFSVRYVFENINNEFHSKIVSILNKKYGEAVKNDEDLMWKNKKVKIVVEFAENRLRVLYKSLEIEELKNQYNNRKNSDEENYLFSVF